MDPQQASGQGRRRRGPPSRARRGSVRFWDSSAVVPLLIHQERSSRVASWVSGDNAMVVWTLTPVEVVSALRRLVRERAVSEDAARVAEIRLGEMMERGHVVIDVEGVKSLAARLLRSECSRSNRAPRDLATSTSITTWHLSEVRLGEMLER